MDNEAEQVHENEKKSQNDDGEQSLEQQNKSPRNQKTEDADNSENDSRPGEKEGTMQMMFCLEKQNLADKSLHSEINISVLLFILAETCKLDPSVDQQVDGEAPSAPAG